MANYYNPGCALLIYKESLVTKLYNYLKETEGILYHDICCHNPHQLNEDDTIINTCAGCDRRFSTEQQINTYSIWEKLANDDNFNFPDYSGLVVSIQDPCPIRHKSQVHQAVRKLLAKMNIKVIENENSQTKSICCGDSSYGKIPNEKIEQAMKTRAQSMPCDEVVVYCISCRNSMIIGGKKPRYLLDLLFNEPTLSHKIDLDLWHQEINEFIKEH